MADILLYTSLFTGSLLVLLLLLSLIGGLDLDIDVDFDSGGLGYIKSGLTFISIGTWVVKIVLVTSESPWLAALAGLAAGGAAVFILSMFLKFLLSNQSFVNWSSEDAINLSGKVYLKIPKNGTGIIQVDINGATRELKAKTINQKEIKTGAIVEVIFFIKSRRQKRSDAAHREYFGNAELVEKMPSIVY